VPAETLTPAASIFATGGVAAAAQGVDVQLPALLVWAGREDSAGQYDDGPGAFRPLVHGFVLPFQGPQGQVGDRRDAAGRQQDEGRTHQGQPAARFAPSTPEIQDGQSGEEVHQDVGLQEIDEKSVHARRLRGCFKGLKAATTL